MAAISPKFDFSSPVPLVVEGGGTRPHDLSRSNPHNQLKPPLFNEYERVMNLICIGIGDHVFDAVDDPMRIPGGGTNIGYALRHVYHEHTNRIDSLDSLKYNKTGGPISGAVSIGETLTVTGETTLNGALSVPSGLLTTQGLTVTGNTIIGNSAVNSLEVRAQLSIPTATSLGTAIRLGSGFLIYASGASVARTSGSLIVDTDLTVSKNVNIGDGPTDSLSINSTVSITAPVGISNSLVVSENLTVNGNATIGNASTDILTVNANTQFSAPVTFGATVTNDIINASSVNTSGESSLGGIVHINGTVTIGNLADSTLTLGGTSVLGGSLQITSDRVTLPSSFSLAALYQDGTCVPRIVFGYKDNLEASVINNLAAVFYSTATIPPSGTDLPIRADVGRFISGKVYNLAWNDIAETVPSDGSYEPGDMVAFIPGRFMTTKYEEGKDSEMFVGVCSSDPGFIVGWNPEYENPRFIALKGMVWIKLDRELPYGDIYLTPSGKICTTAEVLRMPACKRIGTVFEKKEGMARIFI